jgi:hypothetical protein
MYLVQSTGTNVSEECTVSTFRVEAKSSLQFVPISQIARCHTPEDFNLNIPPGGEDS